MNVVEKFLHEVNALQEEYGLFIVANTEEELLVSLERNDNQSAVVCLTGDYTIKELNKDKAIVINELLLRLDDE